MLYLDLKEKISDFYLKLNKKSHYQRFTIFQGEENLKETKNKIDSLNNLEINKKIENNIDLIKGNGNINDNEENQKEKQMQ